MSGSYSRYETVAGQASEPETFSRLLEHLRLASECCYVLGHLKKANDSELIGTGFLAIGQLLERMVGQVTNLITKGRLN